MEDEALYRQYLAGDRSSGDLLMLRLGGALTAWLDAFLHDPQDAEDLMLDCFAELLVKKPRIAEGHFRAYLFRMARYQALGRLRRRLRRREFSLDESLLAQEGLPEDEVLAHGRSATLYRCLNRVDQRFREALWLVYGMEMSYAQAAEALGCGIGRIRYLLEEGKQRMRRELEKEGVTDADI